jgi:hypothetical protein
MAPPRGIGAWDIVLHLTGSPMPPALKARVEAHLAEEKVKRSRAIEASADGQFYRAELTRLGLPQPDTLDGVDFAAEWMRLLECSGSPNSEGE